MRVNLYRLIDLLFPSMRNQGSPPSLRTPRYICFCMCASETKKLSHSHTHSHSLTWALGCWLSIRLSACFSNSSTGLCFVSSSCSNFVYRTSKSKISGSKTERIEIERRDAVLSIIQLIAGAKVRIWINYDIGWIRIT